MASCKYYDCGWCYAPDDVETSARSQSACFDPDYCPYLKSQMKETDKVLIEGDTATINGIKYKRVEEPKPKKLFDVIRNLGYSVDMCYEIVDAVRCWLPDEHCNITDYDLGWNDVLRKIKDGLG